MKKFCTAICALLAPGVLLAQEDAVVVTGTRVPQPSLQLPMSVDRIYGEEIREARPAVNLSESLGRVPGIVVQNRQNYAQDLQISSRGFGARSTFGVRGIRLIADGIPATMPDGQGQAATFSLGSAERVEVLRGPFSALYGNSAGGVINVQTEDGPERPMVQTDFLVGSYRTYRGELKFGGQFGSLNGIADLSRFHTNGYRDHSQATRDHQNVKLRQGIGDSTSVSVVANSLRQLQTQDPGGLNRADYEANPRQVIPTQIALDARKTIIQDQVGTALNHRLSGGAQLQGSFYYGERWVEQYLNIPRGAQNAATHSGAVVNIDRNFSGGALRYTDQVLESLRLSFGAEYDRMHDRRKGFINDFGTAGALKRDEDNTAQTTGVYGQGEWRFTEQWSAHLGVRRTRVAFRNKDHFIATGNGDDSGDRVYTATTPVAGILFKIDSNKSLYANYGRGFETPTFVELANQNGASGLNFGLEAARSRHLELGAKSVAPGWGRVNAAVFDIATENELAVDTNSGGRATFKNVGHTDRRGFELAAETLTGRAVEARLAYTYLKATYRESFDTRFLLPPAPAQTVAAGSMIPGVPRHVLYGELRFRREPFFAQLEGLAKSRVAVNDPNTEFASGYAVFNLATGLVQQAAGWRVTEYFRIDNLGDRNYVGSVIVNEGNGRYYEPSPRRSMTLGLQASLRF
jgi:iron complex outermembrane recepter protein